jgi:septum formation protein
VPRVDLILASSSPRRRRYLRDLGFTFRSIPPDVDETKLRSETPRQYVRRLAIAKAREVTARHAKLWVVGADTTVVLGSAILGKPADEAEARRMLRRLSGRSHRVLSGIALARAEDGIEVAAVAATRVVFRKLTEEEILWYVRTSEPYDKAGAYGIQGKGGLLVERIEGSFSNVAGFPVEAFHRLWRSRGLPLPGPSVT